MCRKLYVYKFYILFGEIYCECSVIKILCLVGMWNLGMPRDFYKWNTTSREFYIQNTISREFHASDIMRWEILHVRENFEMLYFKKFYIQSVLWKFLLCFNNHNTIFYNTILFYILGYFFFFYKDIYCNLSFIDCQIINMKSSKMSFRVIDKQTYCYQ